MRDAKRLGEEGMLTSLPAAVKSGLEFALPGGDDQHRDVGLTGTHDHVGDVVLVSWRIHDGVALDVGLELGPADLHGLSLGSLLFVGVHNEGQEPGLAVEFLGLPLVLFDGPLVNVFRQVEDVA